MRRLILPFLCILTLCIALLRMPAYAQGTGETTVTAPKASTEETIDLTVGDILEMLPVHSVRNPMYAWILTQERSFLQAERTPVFRTRLIQPGSYLLIAEIKSGDQTVTLRRSFHLQVQPREAGGAITPLLPDASGATLVTTQPLELPDTQRVVLREGQQVLKLLPVDPDRTPLALDLDTTIDTNGDGSATNDVENEQTFFQTDATPLFLWFASPLTSQQLSITTVNSAGDATIQQLQIFSSAYAKQLGIAVSPAKILVTPLSTDTFTFSVAFEETMTTPLPLVYQWQFGDGQESIVSKSTHTFPAAGTYTVELRIRNLLTGDEVARFEHHVTVASPATGTGATPGQAPDVETTTGGWTLSSLLLPSGVILGMILLGAGLGLVIRRSRRGRPLSETLAGMEESITKETEGTPPPLVIQRKTEQPVPHPAPPSPPPPLPPPSPESRVFSAEKRDHPPELKTSNFAPGATMDKQDAQRKTQHAPAWLQKGLDTPPSPPSSPAAAVPAALVPPPKPAPAPSPPSPPTPPASPKSDLSTVALAKAEVRSPNSPVTPPWLQPAKSPPSPAAPPPASLPKLAPAAVLSSTPPPMATVQQPSPPPAAASPQPAPAPSPPSPPTPPQDIGQRTQDRRNETSSSRSPQSDLSTVASAQAAVRSPQPPAPPAADPTIAVIRADSIEEQKKPPATGGTGSEKTS